MAYNSLSIELANDTDIVHKKYTDDKAAATL
jgi:hypothetical protein